ncbi:prostaglandin D2 receptor [Drosophila novamexicana]|uniref:prostaglandin D2 receptor n=1 Tax=Drosophila novamexicana TaxID=47314 RepID=UPI0011E5E970|nr:prostaglandin D2 receptor [Drosophila novamexicana]
MSNAYNATTSAGQLLQVATELATNSSTSASANDLYKNRQRLLFSMIVMGIGVLGNFLALIILARKKHNKNSKYTFMLRCLATNDLVGLLGMSGAALLKYSFPELVPFFLRLDCVGHVLWRFFGVNSGCIAAVMAAERCMALARPFIYHKHITYELIQKSIRSILLVAAIVTFLPFVGFGAYINESNPKQLKCIRYRDATGATNNAYSIFFMVFGSLLCVVIVVCNLFVARVLWIIGRSRTTKRHMNYNLVGREKSIRSIDAESSSGTTLYQAQYSTGSGHHNLPPPRQFHHSNSVTMTAATSPDEIKFAKLMAFLSLSFVLCWMPQMIAIPLAIKENRVSAAHPFFVVADVLMALHFTLDPYIYVVTRTKSINWSLFNCIKRWRSGWRGGRLQRSQSDQSRIRTTTTEQNTLDCNFN